MFTDDWAPQLSALALLDAYRSGSFAAVRSVTMDTPPTELHVGLVQLASGLLASFAAATGQTVPEATELFRSGMLKAATA